MTIQPLPVTENYVADLDAVIHHRQNENGRTMFLVIPAGAKVKHATWKGADQIPHTLLETYRDDQLRLGEIEKQADNGVSFDFGIFARASRFKGASEKEPCFGKVKKQADRSVCVDLGFFRQVLWLRDKGEQEGPPSPRS
ncbi:hypothetical protein B0A55_03533 [Friedmanniomyces simplex]|uniref:Uncharacterized protein n=1 Tax=Friedmanniomyces simplex TaxID=329884 RepID=A0A4U0XH46_9PEZI|nr:hypothetical protein B0A55_03533 [Friedmanniomyces simplex]